MPRQRQPRKIVEPPKFKGYKPYGVNGNRTGKVELLYEEYEAIKLADYDLLNHDEAARLMGISRPTFARIYENARRQIARALVEVRHIESVYGNAVMDKTWYICNQCHARFTIPAKVHNQKCPMCSSISIQQLSKEK